VHNGKDQHQRCITDGFTFEVCSLSYGDYIERSLIRFFFFLHMALPKISPTERERERMAVRYPKVGTYVVARTIFENLVKACL
jgi:hypothetical protein